MSKAKGPSVLNNFKLMVTDLSGVIAFTLEKGKKDAEFRKLTDQVRRCINTADSRCKWRKEKVILSEPVSTESNHPCASRTTIAIEASQATGTTYLQTANRIIIPCFQDLNLAEKGTLIDGRCLRVLDLLLSHPVHTLVPNSLLQASKNASPHI